MTTAFSDAAPAQSPALTLPDKPRLRSLEVIPFSAEGEEFLLFRDRDGIAEDAALPQAFGGLLSLLNGRRTRAQIIVEYAQRGGEQLPSDFLDEILAQLDEKLLLDSPRFRESFRATQQEFEAAPSRPAALAGAAYPDDPQELRALLDGFYERAETLKVRPQNGVLSNKTIRGCVVPHIDFTRGGVVEALAYSPMLDQHFDTLVILGIAHSGVHYPYCLAPKDYETPLGTARCDRAFCDALQSRLGDKLTAEQWAHKNEHSDEFVAVFLQHAEKLKNARIVPILCGGFFDEIRSGASPSQNAELAEFCAALREVVVEAERSGKRIGFIASVDGAHVGTQFGDATPLTEQRLAQIESDDLEFWRLAERGEIEALHAHIARDDNARNVDAHPALYTLLHAFPELRGTLLHYAQAFNESQNIVVSFAAMELWSEKSTPD